MRIAGATITLICGVVALAGVFLPWIKWCEMGFCMTLSGWDVSSYAEMSGELVAYAPYLVLGGSILLMGGALPAFIVAVSTRGGRVAVPILGIFASMGALLAVGGALWYIITVVSEGATEIMGYGTYVAAAAGVLGLIFAIVMLASRGGQSTVVS